MLAGILPAEYLNFRDKYRSWVGRVDGAYADVLHIDAVGQNAANAIGVTGIGAALKVRTGGGGLRGTKPACAVYR